MRPVERGELLDYQTYEDRRPGIREQVMRAKDARRVIVGRYLTFLFENRETIRYQVQEMMRAERIVREAEIQHELDTYNELLGGPGELGCTLLVGIEDPGERDEKLRDWRELPRHLYVKLEDGTLVRPAVDERQIGEERLSSVQYLKFPAGGRVPVAVGCDLPGPAGETALGEVQRAALARDIEDEEGR